MDLTRSYELRMPDGTEHPIEVRIFDLRPSDRDWEVSFTIAGLGYDTPRKVYGIDGVQALLLAVSLVRRVLTVERAPERGVVTYLGEPIGEDAGGLRI